MSHPTCIIVEDGEVCGRPSHDRRRGLCGMHHGRLLRRGTTDPSTRGMRHPKLRSPEWLRKRYIEDGLSIEAIAEGQPFNYGSVRRALIRAGIPLKGHGRVKHGHACRSVHKSPTYLTWQNMVSRCTSPNATGYSAYGGRGITVCDRWRGPGGFSVFLADMGERPEGMTLDRIDVDSNYEPGNCRWATPKQQQHNKQCERCRARKTLILDLLFSTPA